MKIRINFRLAVLFFSIFLLVVAPVVSGQGLVNCAGGRDGCTIPDLIRTAIRVINFFVGASWLVAVFFVFWGAFGLATSYGNPEKIESGKKTIQNAIVGFFLIMIAFILINWLVMVLGGYTIQDMLQFFPLT